MVVIEDSEAAHKFQIKSFVWNFDFSRVTQRSLSAVAMGCDFRSTKSSEYGSMASVMVQEQCLASPLRSDRSD